MTNTRLSKILKILSDFCYSISGEEIRKERSRMIRDGYHSNIKTVEQLSQALKVIGVPDFYYNLTGVGRKDDRISLIRDGEMWSVFYSEKGSIFSLAQYESEAEACKDAFIRIMRRFGH